MNCYFCIVKFYDGAKLLGEASDGIMAEAGVFALSSSLSRKDLARRPTIIDGLQNVRLEQSSQN